jgi:hypothetical protein
VSLAVSHAEVRNIEQTASRRPRKPDSVQIGCKSLPTDLEMVMEMDDSRCIFVAIEIEDPRCKGLCGGAAIEMDDPRCKSMLSGTAMEMEDPRCKSMLRSAAMVMEDPRCQNLHNW